MWAFTWKKKRTDEVAVGKERHTITYNFTGLIKSDRRNINIQELKEKERLLEENNNAHAILYNIFLCL